MTIQKPLNEGILAGNKTLTPLFLITTVIETIVVLASVCISLKLTGLLPVVMKYLEGHEWLILQIFVVFLLFKFLLMIPGLILIAFLKELFNMKDKPEATSSDT